MTQDAVSQNDLTMTKTDQQPGELLSPVTYTVTKTPEVEAGIDQMRVSAGQALDVQPKPDEAIKVEVDPPIDSVERERRRSSDVIDAWFNDYFKLRTGGTFNRDGRHIIGERGDHIQAERERVSDAVAVLKQRLGVV